jgi:hypothetical protein
MVAARLLAGLLLLGALGKAVAGPAVFPSGPVTPAESPVPVESLPADLRDKARSVLDTPSLNAKAPAESFHAAPDVYQWLLDNPQTAIKLWRQLSAKVSDVVEEGPGKYRWKDGQGSEVLWQTAHKAEGLHVWYAEGKIKASALLPASGFRALAVLRYSTGHDADGKPAIRHQVQFFLRCDGRAMSLAARLLGNSAPRLAEQYLGQLQLFYGGMAWYLCQDTARARKMLTQTGVLQDK